MSRKIQIVIGLLAMLLLTGVCLIGILPVGLFWWAAAGLMVIAILGPRISSAVWLFVAALAFTLICADILIRIALPSYLYYSAHHMFFNRLPERPYLARYKPNQTFEGKIFGDLVGLSGINAIRDERQSLFISDAYGLRNMPDAASRAHDIVVLGDSYGSGLGTSQEKTWSYLLEKKSGLNIYNIAMPGSPWKHYIDLLVESERLALRPGTAILLSLYEGNDLDERYGDERNLSELPVNGPLDILQMKLGTFRNRSPVRRLTEHLIFVVRLSFGEQPSRRSLVHVEEFLNQRKLGFFEPEIQRARRSEEDIKAHVNFAKFIRTLDELRGHCKENELTFMIVLFPSNAQVYRWLHEHKTPWTSPSSATPFSRILQDYCSDYQIPFLDLYPGLVKGSQQVFETAAASLWWYDDTHMNEHGHRLVAESIYHDLLQSRSKNAVPLPVNHGGSN